MHHTAFKIGGLVMQTYCPGKNPSILEVGSLDVNGSLRKEAPRTERYIGLDFESGPGVDFVVGQSEPWPVEDGSFDLVMASSVFEHDPTFWLTFVEMCRKTKPGGHVYVSAPSNGTVHRYPQDCWRFYPDSAPALAQLAQREGIDVTLVESFVAEREHDVWNDFCAVYRREPGTKPLNEDFVYSMLACTNVHIWNNPDVIRPREATQDMVLIAEQRDLLEHLEGHVAEQVKVIAAAQEAAAEAQRDGQAAAASVRTELEKDLAAQNEAFQIERQAFGDAEKRLRADVGNLSRELEESRAKVAECRAEVESVSAQEVRLVAELGAAHADGNALRARVTQADEQVALYQQRIGEIEANLADGQADLKKAWAEAASHQHACADLKNELERLSRDRDEGSEKKGEAALQRRSYELLEAELENHKAMIEDLRADSEDLEALKKALRSADDAMALTDERASLAEKKLEDRYSELAFLTKTLLSAEDKLAHSEEALNWLLEVNRVLMSGGPWWWNLMPRRWRRERELRRLARRSLFDAHAYVLQYPDVRQAGLDPLYHYMFHGLHEERSGRR